MSKCRSCGIEKDNNLPLCKECWLKKRDIESKQKLIKRDSQINVGELEEKISKHLKEDVYKGLSTFQKKVAQFLMELRFTIVHEPTIYLMDDDFKHRIWFPTFLIQGFGIYIDVFDENLPEEEFLFRKKLYIANNFDVVFISGSHDSSQWKYLLTKRILNVEKNRLNILFGNLFDKIVIDDSEEDINLKKQFSEVDYKSSTKSKSEYHEKVEEIREKYPKAYMPWTESDDILLEDYFTKGKPISEIAELFKRKPSAIHSRLKKLGFIEE